MIAYAERDTFSALVNWTEPVATDNSGLTPKMRTNYHSPQKFGKGAHVIVYSAMDQSGNKATCTFTVVVTGITNYRVGVTYIMPRASFPDISLSMKICVKVRREGENGRCAWSPVTCISRLPLCKKRSS